MKQQQPISNKLLVPSYTVAVASESDETRVPLPNPFRPPLLTAGAWPPCAPAADASSIHPPSILIEAPMTLLPRWLAPVSLDGSGSSICYHY